jgi:hypothetical protein
MTAQTSPARWHLTITCPRPRNRAVDDFHVRPERVANVAAMFLGARAELVLTARTVRFSITREHPITDVGYWQKQLAFALDCLYLDVERDGRRDFRLPRPVRVELRETDDQNLLAVKAQGQAQPIEGERVT